MLKCQFAALKQASQEMHVGRKDVLFLCMQWVCIIINNRGDVVHSVMCLWCFVHAMTLASIWLTYRYNGFKCHR